MRGAGAGGVYGGGTADLESEHDRSDGKCRLPVLPQNIKAHFALQVNVWVVHLASAAVVLRRE